MINRLSRKPEGRERKQGFVYKKRDPSAVKARAEQKGGGFDSPFKQGIDTFRPKAGDNLIRFLPPTWDDHEHYGYEIWLHRRIGADNSSYLCLSKMQDKPCPICKAAKEARDAGEQDEAKAMQAAKVVCAWVIDRDGDTQPVLYPMSWTMDRDIAALCINNKTGATLLIDHPDEGYDVTIKRSGHGLQTRYFGIAIDRDPSPIDESEKKQDKIIEYIQENPIPSTLHFYDAAYLEKVLEGTAEAKDEELDEDERPARRSRRDEEEDERPSSRRRGRDEPEEEEEEERPRRGRRGSEDEEAEEDTRSARRREEDDEPPRRRRSEPEPEEEEEQPRSRRRSEPEEEEEEAPRSRRRSDPEEEDEAPRRRGRASEDEEEEAPRRRRSEPEEEEEERPRKGRRAAEPEEEEESGEGEGAEEEDEPRSRRTSRRPVKEEEEEEEAPRRRGRRE